MVLAMDSLAEGGREGQRPLPFYERNSMIMLPTLFSGSEPQRIEGSGFSRIEKKVGGGGG